MEFDWDEVKHSYSQVSTTLLYPKMFVDTMIDYGYPCDDAISYFSELYGIPTYPGYLEQIHRITLPPQDLLDTPTHASTLAFDPVQELLWVGSDTVSIGPHQRE